MLKIISHILAPLGFKISTDTCVWWPINFLDVSYIRLYWIRFTNLYAQINRYFYIYPDKFMHACMHAAQCSSSSIVLCASVTVVELPGKDWTSSSKRR